MPTELYDTADERTRLLLRLEVIATAKVIRTFLIVETVRLSAHGEALDFLSFSIKALCPVPSAFCYICRRSVLAPLNVT